MKMYCFCLRNSYFLYCVHLNHIAANKAHQSLCIINNEQLEKQAKTHCLSKSWSFQTDLILPVFLDLSFNLLSNSNIPLQAALTLVQ